MTDRVSTVGWILRSCALARPRAARAAPRILQGEAVSASSHAVVFRLSGTETRIRFRFRMEP